MSSVRRPAAVAILLALLLTGCGGSDTTGQSHTSPSSVYAQSSRLSPTPPPSVSRLGLPAVGTTQRVESQGASLSVTLRSVIDPLRDSGADLAHGTRAVAVVFQIRSSGPRTYDSSATGDITVAVSSGSVTPVLATRGECRTPVQDFDRYITAGEDRIGCVVFEINDAAAVDAVRFAPHAQQPRALTWAA